MHASWLSNVLQPQESMWWLPITWPASVAYGAMVRGRRRLYDLGFYKSLPAPGNRPVISIGGLEAGGSGKTPTAAYLLRHLVAQGQQPGLLTRGVGRLSHGLVVRRSGGEASAALLGDEPAMLVHGGLDVPIAVCAQRRLGAAALAQLGCHTMVLDDGFAHRALRRALDIVVLRGETPLGNGHLLPRGSLREPVCSLRRADILWFNWRRAAPSARTVRALEQRFSDKLCVLAQLVPCVPYDRHGVAQKLQGAPIVAAAGIARPQDFLYHLRQMGADLRDFVVFRDHQVFDAAQLTQLYRRVQALGCVALVVTAKDAIKLAALPSLGPLWICDTQVVIHRGEQQLQKRLQEL